MRCIRVYRLPVDPLQFYVVFGGTDENLLFYVNRLKALVGDEQYFVSAPAVIWFELDQTNFARLLNEASGTFWTQTRLNDVFETDPNSELLYSMTEVLESPRKTWSRGH